VERTAPSVPPELPFAAGAAGPDLVEGAAGPDPIEGFRGFRDELSRFSNGGIGEFGESTRATGMFHRFAIPLSVEFRDKM
jgi:hypothetical protein